MLTTWSQSHEVYVSLTAKFDPRACCLAGPVEPPVGEGEGEEGGGAGPGLVRRQAPGLQVPRPLLLLPSHPPSPSSRKGREVEGQDRGFWVFPQVSLASRRVTPSTQVYCVAFNETYKTKVYQRSGEGEFR